MGPAANPFFRRICSNIQKDPKTISAADIDTFAKMAYAMAKHSLGEVEATRLYNRLLALKK